MNNLKSLFLAAMCLAFVVAETASSAVSGAQNTGVRNPPGISSSPNAGTEVLVPMAAAAEVAWRYTTQAPNAGWNADNFDDAAWKTGRGPFGAGTDFIGPWRTTWEHPDIWLRHAFAVDKAPRGRLVVRIFYDEDVEVYLNGKPVLSRQGFVKSPIAIPLDPSALGLLRKGANLLAVHCHQTRGGQGIDVGLTLTDNLEQLLRSQTYLTDNRRLRSSTAAIGESSAPPDKRTDAGHLMTRWAKEVTPDHVWTEYPRPQMVRGKWLNLNGLWDYAIVGQPQWPKTMVNAETDPLLKTAPPAPLKWDGRILVPFAPESPLSKVSRFVWPSQLLWYHKEIEIPPDWRGQRVLLHFEAVDWHCVVWVNGVKVGEHKGGYVPFSLDMTEALKPEGPQQLTVVVWDPTSAGDQANGKQGLPRGSGELRYPPSSGIWQTVWLEPVPEVSIRRLILIPDVDNQALTAEVELSGAATGCEVALRAFDGHQIAGTATGVAPGKVRLKVPQPKLWSPDSPFLYDLKAVLRRNGQVIDEVGSYFGMRQVEVSRDAAARPRIMLNGRPIFLFGPLDQGIWPDSILTPPSDAAGRFEVQYLKDIGCNIARFHMIVHPERWYYWCDKLGLVVWQDFVRKRPQDSATDSSTARQWETEQRELMDHLRNHPALLEWIVFNESWGQYDTERITRWVMQYDPSRVVCNATGWVDHPLGNTFDIHDYSYHPSVAAPGQIGDRAMCIGECGGFNVYVPSHTWGDYPVSENFDPAGDDFRPTLKNGLDWEKPYADWLEGLWLLRSLGLCAAVYTQIYDTGGECNGWLTYDRAVSKIPPETLKRLHDRLYQPLAELNPIVPLLKDKTGAVRWRQGEASPGWEQAQFDDAAWAETQAPLTLPQSASSRPQTRLYARREFTLKTAPRRAALMVEGWGEFTLWLNGQRVQTLSNGRTESYEPVSLAQLSPAALTALRPGHNVLAIEAVPASGKMRSKRETQEAASLDFGLVEINWQN